MKEGDLCYIPQAVQLFNDQEPHDYNYTETNSGYISWRASRSPRAFMGEAADKC